jgi:hypothetical protein
VIARVDVPSPTLFAKKKLVRSRAVIQNKDVLIFLWYVMIMIYVPMTDVICKLVAVLLYQFHAMIMIHVLMIVVH